MPWNKAKWAVKDAYYGTAQIRRERAGPEMSDEVQEDSGLHVRSVDCHLASGESLYFASKSVGSR